MSEPEFLIKQTPVLVVGTGISGLFTALKLSSQGIQTLLLTKSTLGESNSRYAQGGIAAVLPSNPGDSLELHLRDTIQAGAGLCNEEASRSILAEGYPAIEDLLAFGVPFDRKLDKGLALTREAAHSVDRILHAGGDATGHSVELTLIEKVRQDPLIEVIEHAQVVQLLVRDGACVGCRAFNHHTQQEILVQSPHTILATGGIGRLYSHTTNPAIATGDGIALAYEAGAKIENMEFIQFHPTAFYGGGQLRFLISEALRGEGGILRNKQGVAFARHYHPDGEMAPRDIVTRAIDTEMRKAGMPHVYLDITHLPPETIETRFPNILANCLTFGVDIRKDQIPVAPAAHYLMGGITVDTDAQTTLPGLYSVGETAYTGLHGANRLASNSLLECVVLARRAAQRVALLCQTAPPLTTLPRELLQADTLQDYRYETELNTEDLKRIQTDLDTLHHLMWEHVGILRHEEGLSIAQNRLQALNDEVLTNGWRLVVPLGFELYAQLIVARLIIDASKARKESRGAHYRSDYPEANTILAMPTISMRG